MADALFAQADTNQDQRLDINEFRNFAGAGGDQYGAAAGGYGSSSYESSSYESSTAGGALGGDLAYGGGAAAYDGAGYGASSYESSQYSSSVGGAGGDYSAGASGFSSQAGAVQQYQTDAQGLFKDSNPQIVRRPAPGGNLTYTQNIKVRFLQPPPIPPPGVRCSPIVIFLGTCISPF